ncbi:hypothetical protein ACLMYS_003818 [Salmonella enterica]
MAKICQPLGERVLPYGIREVNPKGCKYWELFDVNGLSIGEPFRLRHYPNDIRLKSVAIDSTVWTIDGLKRVNFAYNNEYLFGVANEGYLRNLIQAMSWQIGWRDYHEIKQ